MDKIQQEKLLQEVSQRMQHLFEYSFYNGNNEAGEPGGAPAQGGDPNAMGGAPMGGGDPNAMGGGDPNAMGGDPGMMGGDPSMMGGDPNAMGGGDPNAVGGQPNPDMAMGDDSMGGDPMGDAQPGPDDNVIDITALTDAQEGMQNAQEEQQATLDDINSKFDNLLKVIDKFNQALDTNDAKIGELKREIAKRNPTEEETMNVRLYAGGNPFDQKPKDFWDKFKDINNHYNITSNNEAPQYQIRKSDIDNVNDRLIDKGFEDSLNEANRSLKDYFIN